MRASLVAITVVAFGFTTNGQGVVNEAVSTPIQILSRMAGCWRQETSTSATIDEMWMAPAGGVMLGTSRTVARSRAVEYEFMRIRADNSGVTFFAQLPDQPETAFRMVTIDAQTVVFENLKHDFPQRVIYRIARDTLTGRIEGTQNGKERSVDYPMRRVGCP
jgi:hypothetical protein